MSQSTAIQETADSASLSAAERSDADAMTTSMADAIRFLAVDAVQAAKSGHPGMPMGMADVATVLFSRFMTFNAADPHWPDRDRFILSAGHGSMLLYALLYLTGTPGLSIDDLKDFRQVGSKTPGHPEYGHTAGVETTTGPLGQGFGNAVGLALAERMAAARFGDEIVDHYTYVIAGDGCLMEGISHEAASLAGHLKLSKLVVLWDDNGITIDGKTDMAVSDDVAGRFAALGWHVDACDGHDPESIDRALRAAKADTERPSLIACKTKIGRGAPSVEGTAKAHGAPVGDAGIAEMRAALGWEHAPFEIPDAVLSAWRATGARGAAAQAAWEQRLTKADAAIVSAFETTLSGSTGPDLAAALSAHKAALSEAQPAMATRVASQKALEAFYPAVPALVGGSADLTGSNNTKPAGASVLSPEDCSGRYIHFGVREHGMAAALNGMALHGGFIPYGGTFLVFTDYLRPSLRMSALMGVRVIYVMTHDSIGLGEDGPTHQPVEHLASLRAMPNVQVFRPADAVETAECWAAAMDSTDCPSVLALTRQNLPTLRTTHTDENLSALGAYVLAEAEVDGVAVASANDRAATLLATGSEVEIAMQAREALAAQGIAVAVVSMPCWERFATQPAEQIAAVLGPRDRRVSIEAAGTFGWERWVEPDAAIGMDGFGASGPYKALYDHFGFTAEAVVERVLARLGKTASDA